MKDTFGLSDYYISGDFKEFEHLFYQIDGYVKSYKSGATLCEAGDYRKKVFYIIEGSVNVSILNTDGKEFVLLRRSRGSIIPLTCTDYEPRILDTPISIVADSDCRVIEFAPHVLREMIIKYPLIGVKCVEHASKEESVLIYEVISFSIKTSEMRVYEVLYAQYKHNVMKGKDATISFSQDEFAKSIGITRVQNARILQKLRENGIIETSRNKITILDSKKLRMLCKNLVDEE